jgi:Zn-dependent M28 family amino/carboxypeptidase
MPPGPTGALFTVRLGAPVEVDAPQRNVLALLEGSDPKLAGTYVLVTAHYDGQGTRPAPDRVWNSANDNGSGTVSVIELASVLGPLKKHPRRSVVFIAFHGEESGLVGSRFYAEHPVFPLEKTVADINIEMVGRTDDTEGDRHRRASLTGFDYSDLGEVFRRAGDRTGVTVFKHEKNSDPYFSASDNQPLAAQGVPAHTICVTFEYPDYHGPADTWQKIDYENMALTVRMIGTALLIVAESASEPRWNPAVTRAGRYLEAWKKQRGRN